MLAIPLIVTLVVFLAWNRYAPSDHVLFLWAVVPLWATYVLVAVCDVLHLL